MIINVDVETFWGQLMAVESSFFEGLDNQNVMHGPGADLFIFRWFVLGHV